MPCRSDFLEPRDFEKESQRICRLVVYLCAMMGRETPSWAHQGAEDIYGSRESMDKIVAFLCSLCKEAPEEFIYNARDRNARDLADWWEDHQKADAERERREQDEAYRASVITRAKAKLSPEEREALGL